MNLQLAHSQTFRIRVEFRSRSFEQRHEWFFILTIRLPTFGGPLPCNSDHKG